MSVREAVAKNLRRLREEKRWTQGQLSDKSGVVGTTIGRIERLEMNPSLEVLEHLAVALDVPVSTLVAAPGEDLTPTLSSELEGISKSLAHLQARVDHLRGQERKRRK